jgi:hypothetical protein
MHSIIHIIHTTSIAGWLVETGSKGTIGNIYFSSQPFLSDANDK